MNAIKRLQEAGKVQAECRGAFTGTAVGASLQPEVLGRVVQLFWLEGSEQCPDQGLTWITEDYMKFENALGSGKFWKLGHFDQDCMQIRAEIRWNHVTSFRWSVNSGP